jgi:hypothetical protein
LLPAATFDETDEWLNMNIFADFQARQSPTRLYNLIIFFVLPADWKTHLTMSIIYFNQPSPAACTKVQLIKQARNRSCVTYMENSRI